MSITFGAALHMRTKLMLLAVVVCAPAPTLLFAAGPPLDAVAVETWPSVDHARISEDGAYVAYTIITGEAPSSVELVSTDARWKLSLPAVRSTEFVCQRSSKCRSMVFHEVKGKLGIVRLGTASVEFLGDAESYQVPAKGDGTWLSYRVKSAPAQLRIRNLSSGKERRYEDVIDSQFSEDGRVMLLKVSAHRQREADQALQWIDLRSDRATTIWEGQGVGSTVFDPSGRRLAFVVEERAGERARRSFWHYSMGEAQASRILDGHAAGLDPDLRLNEVLGFTKDGNGLRVDLMRMTPSPMPLAHAVDVDVWSYRDERLQSQQIADIAAGRAARTYAAVVDIEKRTLRRLEQDGDSLGESSFNSSVGEVTLRDRRSGNADRGEYHWSSAGKLSTELVFFRDGRHVPLTTWDAADESRPQLSPAGRFVVYFDPDRNAFLSHEVSSGAVRDLTSGISTEWSRFDASSLPSSWSRLRGVAGWLQEDVAVLIYDRYDLWLLDLKGAAAPVNLTKGYGKRHHTIFSVMAQTPPRNRVFARSDPLILPAFDRVTKESGFFTQRLGGRGDPQRLTMGPYAYYRPAVEIGMPIKAKHASKYLVRRESAAESANYFVTADFRSFTPLSNVHPEIKYNWLTAQLVTWRRQDGVMAQGILYKPENFDPARRYPVIFNYYELAADDLNAYLKPTLLGMGCEIDIPSYVSRGYLVFKPDIHYEIGKLRESAVGAVVSAAMNLREKPWVDAGKMGIQGCSFGGIATNSIVTSTGLFAAAVSAAGIADLVSAYGALWLPNARGGASGGASLQSLSERGQERMGGHLWQQPGLYVENSAIFHVDEVTTPILLMHTRDDAICPFANAVEFFTALRRLGKKAWMLQYNEGSHTLEGKSAADFSLRMAQFFDHYLKAAPPPRWMTQGLAARLKGIETGLELDDSGSEPGAGLYQPPPDDTRLHRGVGAPR